MRLDSVLPTFQLDLSVTLKTVLNSEDLEEAGRHPRNPVIKWLTSRDRTPLNNLGLALMAIGAATAVAVWLARFTSKSVPWWPVILGLVVVALGLVLTLATMGRRPADSVIPTDSSDPVGLPPQSAGSSPPGVKPRDKDKVAELTTKIQSYPTVPTDVDEANSGGEVVWDDAETRD